MIISMKAAMLAGVSSKSITADNPYDSSRYANPVRAYRAGSPDDFNMGIPACMLGNEIVEDPDFNLFSDKEFTTDDGTYLRVRRYSFKSLQSKLG